MNIIAITVTYNRTSTLKKCLTALLSQSYPVNRILVVDNCSQEHEREKLKTYIQGKDKIEVIWLSENSGGAGGFEIGMYQAHKKYDPDWYWIMDDDAYPRYDCLELLLKAAKERDNAGCMAPVIFGVDLQQYQLYHHKRLTPLIFNNHAIVEKYEELRAIEDIEANAFVGPIFSRSAIERVGIADGSLFIYGDDTEFTYRVSRCLPCYLVKDAIIDHQDPPLSQNYMAPEAWWKEYYSIRNRYFMISKFHKQWWRRQVAVVCYTMCILKILFAAVIKPKYKGFHGFRAKLLIKAIGDGMKNHRGKQIDPTQYYQQLVDLRSRMC